MSGPQADYWKLTVPQLKARCKELKISGYSKLGKAALLEKLSQYGTRVSDSLGETTMNVLVNDTNACAFQFGFGPSLSQLVPPHDPAGISGLRTSEDDNIAQASVSTINSSLPKAVSPLNSETVSRLTGQNKTKESAVLKKRAEDSSSSNRATSQKKRKVMERPLTYGNENSENNPPGDDEAASITKKPVFTPLKLNTSGPGPGNGPLNNHGLSERGISNVLSLSERPAQKLWSSGCQTSTVGSSGRFRPLVPRKGSKKVMTTEENYVKQGSTLNFTYLDNIFPPPPPGSFQPISIPPSLAQRKRINAWAVILSCLSDSQRKNCALVSRAIRYAVYLSAVPIINRIFGTRRLAPLSQKYNMSMTNFWPYLKQLRLELAYMRTAYAKSFLSRFFGSHMPIAEPIWGCPENDKQLTIALRFLMTRIWFSISVNGADIERTKNSIVVDAREVVKHEIWCITVVTKATPGAKAVLETFYVLEPTCEAIGLVPPFQSSVSASETSESLISTVGRSLYLRIDWSDYVEHRISNALETDRQPSLMAQLKTTNEEEYTKGISKLWLTRISKEGDIGEYKRKVAERYVLACVVQNSVSGQWMSSAYMAQVFAGTASEFDFVRNSLLMKEGRRVNLFLPTHHLVESVHFAASGTKGQDLHPALAVVQTPGREYFILRDNGMEVGCEEDGVWPVWMNLLGCDARGISHS